MDTIILRTKPRRSNEQVTIRFEIVGIGPGADRMKAAIRELEHYPAKSERRAIVDVLSLIDQGNFHIRFTEHTEEDGLEAWMFVLQG